MAMNLNLIPTPRLEAEQFSVPPFQGQQQPMPQPMPEQPQGLLGRIGAGIKRSVQDPNFMDRLTIGLGGMTMRPNEALINLAQNRILQRQKLGMANRTSIAVINQLRSMNENEAADLVEANPAIASEVLKQIVQKKYAKGASPTISGIQTDPETGQQYVIRTNPITGVSERINAEGAVALTADQKAQLEATQLRSVDKEQRLQDRINEGIDAVKGLPILRRGLQLLDTVKTGGINNARLQIKKFFGVEGADEGELSANLGRAVLAQLRQTFGAAFTEREGARLDSLSARFGASTESNKQLLRQAEDIILNAARRGIDAAKQVGDNYALEDINKYVSGEYNIFSSPDKPVTVTNIQRGVGVTQ
jgi:hypothetical protein